MLNDIVQKLQKALQKGNNQQKDKGKKIYNWYEDRIQKIRLQRNFLLFFIVVALLMMCIMVFSMLTIARFKTIEPFVIEIADKSGIVTLVDPVTVKQYSADRKVIEYFLVQYLKARELFDQNLYRYYYYTVVRLLSTDQVYNYFRRTVAISNPDSPVNLYSRADNMDLKIRSIQYLSVDNIQVRFVLIVKMGNKEREINKIANVKYQFATNLSFSEKDRYINPLGFQITSYKVDDENVI